MSYVDIETVSLRGFTGSLSSPLMKEYFFAVEKIRSSKVITLGKGHPIEMVCHRFGSVDGGEV